MKDTFYFTHDYNTRQDVKIKKLIQKHGMCGYGVFWAIIEDLYNNANALPLDYESIAYDLRMDNEVIKSVINDFGLFVIEFNEFGSKSVQTRLEDRNNRSTKARESAFKRWNKPLETNEIEAIKDTTEIETDANALQMDSDCNAIKEIKEIKLKETNKRKQTKPIDHSDELDTIFMVFNEYFKTNYENNFTINTNYNHWRQFYEPAQIEQSIINASKDQFWKDKLTPVILFRQKNQNKEDVDYIGSLLNRKPEMTQKQEMGNAVKESLIFQLNKIKAQ